MSCGCDPITAQPPCGCCEGIRPHTPEVITNRPALSSIAYRAGRYVTFNASMLAALSDPAFPALGPLRTRDTADFSIALLDAWAVALDTVTFYQERFANEAYLRTAVDQRSVFELAALVGYHPSPGVAASATLAFTLSSAPGAPDNVLIPAGTRVQSIPGPGQTAQVFETSADITAQIAWSALPAQSTVPWRLSAGDTGTWIAGTTNHISVGDGLLFVNESVSPTATEFHYVTAIAPNSKANNTKITWDQPLSSPLVPADRGQLSIYVFAKRAGLYGTTAPNPNTLSSIDGVPGLSGTKPKATWDYTSLYTEYSYQIHLDGVYPGLSPQSGGSPQWLVLTGTEHEYTSVFQVTHAADTNPGYFTLTSKTTRLTLQLIEILRPGDKSLSANELIYAFISETPEITAYINSTELTPSSPPLTTWAEDSDYLRAPEMIAPVSGSSIAIIGGQRIAAGQPIGVTGKRLRLQIGLDPSGTFTFVPTGSVSGSSPAPGQVFLVDAFPPRADSAHPGNVLWSVVTLDGVAGTLSAPATRGAIQLLAAKPDPKGDPDVTEAATVQSVAVDGDVTVLTLKGLARIYDATEVKVNANTIDATHGETVQEILGSGDASNGALQFTLKQGPLTYLTDTSESGARSTLEVWVNNLRWREVPNLLECGPADRTFVTKPDATGHRAVRFGNGSQGGRTPTGTSNVRALYRKGIGLAGMVSAGQLSQPLDRPQGVTAAVNPGDASDAADPATADQARASAPLPTLTIGRVVSLEDYQNFALAYAGIAKAWATWTWFGDIRGVFLTVAGENGATLKADDKIVTGLISSLRIYGEPYVPLRVASFEPVQFTFTAGAAVKQPEYSADLVLAQVWQTVSEAFAFDQRQLGQGVAASEIIELIQPVPGVIAVQLLSLGLSGDPAVTPPPPRLCASGPQPPAGAQLLKLDPTTVGRIGSWSP